jgi:hypothetical protein
MKKNRYTEEKIAGVLKQMEAGRERFVTMQIVDIRLFS